MIKKHGGIFGRNPTFNDVTVDGTLAINGPITIDGDVFSGLDYDGTWNASTNTPALASSVGTIGHFYIVSVAGSTNLDGETAWQVGDWAVFNGSVWQKVDGGSTGLLSTLTVTGDTYLATTSGNVGVGATSVAAIYGKTLQIGSGTSEATTSLVGSTGAVFLATVGATGQLIARGGSALVLGSNDVERMRITATGDVGIGTTSPDAKLRVNGAAKVGEGAASNTSKLMVNTVSGVAAGIQLFQDANESWIIQNPASTTALTFGNSGTERMRITATGDVGIGTSTPAVKLDVANGFAIIGANSANPGVGGNIRFRDDTGTSRWLSGLLGSAGATAYSIYDIVAGAERLSITSTGNVGIGTSSPASKLHVVGDIQQDNANYIKGKLAAGTATRLFGLNAANSLYIGGIDASQSETLFVRSGTTQMTLDASGNLGLGVTPSAWGASKFAIQIGARASLYGASNFTVLGNNYFDNGTNNIYIASAAATDYYQSAGSHVWRTAPSGTAGNAISFTQAMTLDASGNLGIGTTSPAYKLDVVGSTSTARFGKLIVVDDTPFYTGANINSGANSLGVGSTGATHVGFFTNNAERARITSSGDFHVARTTTADTTVGISLFNSGTITCARSSSSDADLNLYVYSTGAAAARFYVGMGGTVYATNTTISAISDQRFKENIRDLDVGLNAIMALKPRKFDWKTGKGKDIKDDRGFIAQEFEQVFPDLVDDWADPAPKGEDPYKSVRQDLIPVLVKAIQELKAEVDSLKTQLGA